MKYYNVFLLIHRVVKNYHLSFNDNLTRIHICNSINSLIENTLFKYADGVKVVCDDSNNTPSTIDRGSLIVDVYANNRLTQEIITVHYDTLDFRNNEISVLWKMFST